MPVNATIPLTQDFLETATSYPFLTELIQHPTDGYLYGCYHSSALFGSMIRVKADNFSDITTVDFANDGQHTNPVDMVYVPSTDRFYVLFRNGDANRCVISAVTPSTLARADFFNFEDIQVGAGSITADATNLYVVTFPTDPSYLVIIPIAAPGTFAEPTPLTGFSQAHCVRQFGGKLFVQGMTPPTTGWVMRLTTAGVVEETATFTGEEGEFPVDEIGESSGHIWVGNRDLLGEIRKYSKTSFINPEVILTTQLSKCTCVKTVGGFVWAAFENGRGVRINPANVADRRIYTLNAGEGYHSEFTGGNEFVYTYNYFAGKIARYHIPPDVAPGHINWLTQTSFDRVAPPASVKLLSDGSVVTAGKFSQTVDFGNGVTLTSQLGTDGYVAKYNPSGVAQWARRITGASTPQEAVSLAVDANDNIFALGYYLSFTVKVGVEERVVTNTNQTIASRDCWMAKFTSDGACTWARGFGSVGYDNPGAIQVDSAGDIFVATELGGNTDFGNGVTLTNITGFLNLVKFRGDNGVAQWAIHQVIGRGRSMIVAGGNPIVAGDFYLKKFSGANGSLMWSAPLTGAGASSSLQCKGVAQDVGGNIVICGNANSGSNFGGGAITDNEIFIAGYTPAGAYQWHKTIGGGSDTANAVGISADSPGILGVTGYVQIIAPAFFVSSYVLSANGATEPTLRWTKAGGLVASSSGYGVALNQNNLVLAAEACSGTVDFGGQTARGSGSIGFGAAAIVNYVR